MQFLKRRALVAGAGALSLAACTAEGQGPTTSTTAVAADAATVPRYSDPLIGLFNMPAAAVPNDIAVDYYTPKVTRTGSGARAVLTMALVPGANYSRLSRYHQAVVASSSGIFSGSSMARDLDIEPVLRQVVDQLKIRYPWLELMEDLAAADAANVSLTLVFDIRSRLGVRSGDPTSVEFDCVVFDERRKPVSRLTVEGRATASSVPGFQEAATDALSRLDFKGKDVPHMIGRLTIVAAAALLLAPTAAFADWCETFPGSGKFTDKNCDKPYDNNRGGRTTGTQQQQPQQQPQAGASLRDKIRAKLKDMPDRVELPAHARWQASMARADEALRSADITSDPQEKAAAKRKFDDAMRDARQAGNEHAAWLKDPAERAKMNEALKEMDSNAAAAAAHVGFTGPAPTQTAAVPPAAPAAPAALKKVFTICEQPERGVTTCYEVPPTGNQCLKVYYQGGERTWADQRTSACSAEDLRQRDDYYAGRAVGTGPVPDERSRQLEGFMASLPARCQQDLRNYMLNSRDSNAVKAMDNYRSISSDRECRAGMERLASILGVELPRRRLADADRNAWAGAMKDRPRETVSVPETYNQTPGTGWNVDTGEVIQAGIMFMDFLGAVLGVASGVVGAYNSGGGGGTYYAPAPARSYGGPSGGGYVYRGNNRGSNSTITGGSR